MGSEYTTIGTVDRISPAFAGKYPLSPTTSQVVADSETGQLWATGAEIQPAEPTDVDSASLYDKSCVDKPLQPAPGDGSKNHTSTSPGKLANCSVDLCKGADLANFGNDVSLVALGLSVGVGLSQCFQRGTTISSSCNLSCSFNSSHERNVAFLVLRMCLGTPFVLDLICAGQRSRRSEPPCLAENCRKSAS